MSVHITDSEVGVMCPNGHITKINIQDWEMDSPEVYPKPDCQMGNEICYRFHVDGVPCSDQKCSALLEAKIEVWEYPMGCEEFRSASSNVNAADINSAVSIEMD